MAKVRITPAAKEHLLDIWSYTEAAWSETQADAYIMEIDAAFALLAENPQLGKPRPEIRKGYRSISVKSHVIFYLTSDNNDFVDSIGVLHARMDIPGTL